MGNFIAAAVLEGDSFVRKKCLSPQANDAVQWVAARSKTQVDEARAEITANILKEAYMHRASGATDRWLAQAGSNAIAICQDVNGPCWNHFARNLISLTKIVFNLCAARHLLLDYCLRREMVLP